MKTKTAMQLWPWIRAAGVMLVAQSISAAEVEPGFRSLFNGKDLTGWNGNPALWSVKDGVITGQTTAKNPLKQNSCLVWTNGTLEDFELRCSFKFSSKWGNSGIQYRSKALPNFVVHGYQADLETGANYTGILYEEGGRGILCERGKKVVINREKGIRVVGSLFGASFTAAFATNAEGTLVITNGANWFPRGVALQPTNWNDYVIIAQGSHLQHFINGRQIVDVIDEHETSAAKSGVLALQLHVGLPMTVQFKDLRIKVLGGTTAASDLHQRQ